MQINLALNYGSKSEIINALNEIKKNKLKINEANVSKSLFTKNIPDPDILIRTGNTKRLSNFLLWQSAYSEYYHTKVMWPDFQEKHIDKALSSFNRRQRRFGKVLDEA